MLRSNVTDTYFEYVFFFSRKSTLSFYIETTRIFYFLEIQVQRRHGNQAKPFHPFKKAIKIKLARWHSQPRALVSKYHKKRKHTQNEHSHLEGKMRRGQFPTRARALPFCIYISYLGKHLFCCAVLPLSLSVFCRDNLSSTKMSYPPLKRLTALCMTALTALKSVLHVDACLVRGRRVTRSPKQVTSYLFILIANA